MALSPWPRGHLSGLWPERGLGQREAIRQREAYGLGQREAIGQREAWQREAMASLWPMEKEAMASLWPERGHGQREA